MLKNFFQSFVNFAGSFQSYVLLLFRLLWGTSLAVAGWGKIHNIPKVSGFFEALNIPFPLENAYLVGYLEFIGGICLVVGLATRIVSLPMIIMLITALLTAHWEAVSKIFESPHAVLAESPITYLMACLVLFAFGPGRFSIDHILEKAFMK